MSERDAVTVRRAAVADVPELFRIRTSVGENHIGEADLAALGITHTSVSAMLESGAAAGFCAAVDARVRGFSMALVANREVFALFVEPGFEGRGLGARLLDAAVDWLAALGPGPVRLLTGPGTRAHRFYLRRGWREAPLADYDGEFASDDEPEVHLVLDDPGRGRDR